MTGIKPDRRQLVRAGLWTLPVVAVATAAPAFAASGANLSTSSATAPSRNGRIYTGTITIRNTGTATTSALTVTIQLAAGVEATLSAHTLTGFTATSTTIDTVTFTAVNQVGAGVTVGPLTYTVTRSNSGASASGLTINIYPGNGTQGGPFGPAAPFTL